MIDTEDDSSSVPLNAVGGALGTKVWTGEMQYILTRKKRREVSIKRPMDTLQRLEVMVKK